MDIHDSAPFRQDALFWHVPEKIPQKPGEREKSTESASFLGRKEAMFA